MKSIKETLDCLTTEEKQEMIVEALQTLQKTDKKGDIIIGLIANLEMSKTDVSTIPVLREQIEDFDAFLEKVEAMNSTEKSKHVSNAIVRMTTYPKKIRNGIILGVFALLSSFKALAEVTDGVAAEGCPPEGCFW